MRKRKICHEAEIEENLRVARRFYSHVQTLRSYVQRINSAISSQGFHISLECNDGDYPAYIHVVDHLIIAGKSKPIIPDSVVEGLRGHRVHPHDVLQQVIQNSLRTIPDTHGDHDENVLSLGFSLSRPTGSGSCFRGLDAKAPSAVIEVLLSKPWQQLLSQLGHVVARYLLSSTVLLLPMKAGLKKPRLHVGGEGKLQAVYHLKPCLLQLSGKISEILFSSRKSSCMKDFTVDYRKSILYKTARDKYLPLHLKTVGSQNTEASNLSHSNERKRSVLNDGLPSFHFLQNLRSDRRSALSLYRVVFKDSEGVRATSSTRLSRTCISKKRFCSLSKRMKPVLPIFQDFIERLRETSFRATLGRFCPLPQWAHSVQKLSISLESITSSNTNPKLVARFLADCVKQSFPHNLLGSAKNMEVVGKGIRDFVRHRMRNESFNIASFLANSGFKVTDVPWLFCKGRNGGSVRNPTDLEFRRKKVLQLLTWVFRGLLVPVLLKSFHVTDSAVFGQRILFYRKEIWRMLLRHALKDTLRRDKPLFQPIATDTLVSSVDRRDRMMAAMNIAISPSQFIVCFRIRFLPKASGMRPIQRLQAKLWGKISKNLSGVRAAMAGRVQIMDASTAGRLLERARRSTKSFFTTAQKILRVCCAQKPELLGSSVFGLDDIYAKVVHFKRQWIQNGRRPIFAICFDITKSFDTIPLQFLAETVLPSVLGPTRFVVIRYAVITRNERSGRIMRRFENHVCKCAGEEITPAALYRRHPNAIFIDLARVQILHRQDLLKLLQEFLLNNIVVLPRDRRHCDETRFARQVCGVGQGNPLSPILASLFYGWIERRKLKEFLATRAINTLEVSGNYSQIFMRQIDDSFYASTDERTTMNFAKRMTEGWKGISGFEVNVEKTKSNFPFLHNGQKSLKVLPWCGLLIDTEKFEFRCDFSRYVKPRLSCLRESLSVDFEANCGAGLAGKALTCFRPKIHALLMDGNVNSRRTVALNVYQAALLLALKICSHGLAIDVQNRDFLLNMVQNAMSRISDLVQRTSASAVGRRQKCKLPLLPRETKFLVVHAFWWAFAKRFCSYKKGKVTGRLISSVLKASLVGIEAEVASNSPLAAQMLLSVTFCETNGVLWNIKL